MAKEADFRWLDKSMKVEEVIEITAQSFLDLAAKDKKTAIKILDNYITKK